MKKRIFFLFIVPFFCVAQINTDSNLGSSQPVFEFEVGFPWALNTSAGIKLDGHKIIIIAKSFLVYNQVALSYGYYFTPKISAGLSLGFVKKNTLFNSQKRDFIVFSPQITYIISPPPTHKKKFNGKELKIGLEISGNSKFGFTNQNNNIYFMPFISLITPISLKRKKNSPVPPDNKNTFSPTPIRDLTTVKKGGENYIENFEKSIEQKIDLVNKYFEFKKEEIENDFRVSKKQMENIISKSKTYLGTPYKYGGETYTGIDCSGLFYVSFDSQGVKFPRIAQEIARMGKLIYDESELKRGDFVFFSNTTPANKLITHMGLYLGGGDFIHSSSKRGVMISKINDPHYWREKFLFGKRILK